MTIDCLYTWTQGDAAVPWNAFGIRRSKCDILKVAGGRMPNAFEISKRSRERPSEVEKLIINTEKAKGNGNSDDNDDDRIILHSLGDYKL